MSAPDFPTQNKDGTPRFTPFSQEAVESMQNGHSTIEEPEENLYSIPPNELRGGCGGGYVLQTDLAAEGRAVSKCLKALNALSEDARIRVLNAVTSIVQGPDIERSSVSDNFERLHRYIGGGAGDAP